MYHKKLIFQTIYIYLSIILSPAAILANTSVQKSIDTPYKVIILPPFYVNQGLFPSSIYDIWLQELQQLQPVSSMLTILSPEEAITFVSQQYTKDSNNLFSTESKLIIFSQYSDIYSVRQGLISVGKLPINPAEEPYSYRLTLPIDDQESSIGIAKSVIDLCKKEILQSIPSRWSDLYRKDDITSLLEALILAQFEYQYGSYQSAAATRLALTFARLSLLYLPYDQELSAKFSARGLIFAEQLIQNNSRHLEALYAVSMVHRSQGKSDLSIQLVENIVVSQTDQINSKSTSINSNYENYLSPSVVDHPTLIKWLGSFCGERTTVRKFPIDSILAAAELYIDKDANRKEYISWLEVKCRCLAEKGDSKQAIDILQKEIIKNPDNDRILSILSTLHLMRGDYASSQILLQELLHRDSDNSIVLFNYALCLQGLNEYDKALERWTQVVLHKGSSSSMKQIAQQYITILQNLKP